MNASILVLKHEDVDIPDIPENLANVIIKHEGMIEVGDNFIDCGPGDVSYLDMYLCVQAKDYSWNDEVWEPLEKDIHEVIGVNDVEYIEWFQFSTESDENYDIIESWVQYQKKLYPDLSIKYT
jgi:hypothetical protein